MLGTCCALCGIWDVGGVGLWGLLLPEHVLLAFKVLSNEDRRSAYDRQLVLRGNSNAMPLYDCLDVSEMEEMEDTGDFCCVGNIPNRKNFLF